MVSVAEREAIHTLEAILHTQLPIAEHTTDTHGATESLHAMRRHLVIGSRAQIPADEDDHRRHALCLQILVNAVQVWNARYMTPRSTTSARRSPTSSPTTQPSPA